MNTENNRLTRVEEHLAHQNTVVDDLNDIITELRQEVDNLNRRVSMLMQRAAEQEADNQPSAALADQRPPHW